MVKVPQNQIMSVLPNCEDWDNGVNGISYPPDDLAQNLERTLEYFGNFNSLFEAKHLCIDNKGRYGTPTLHLSNRDKTQADINDLIEQVVDNQGRYKAALLEISDTEMAIIQALRLRSQDLSDPNPLATSAVNFLSGAVFGLTLFFIRDVARVFSSTPGINTFTAAFFLRPRMAKLMHSQNLCNENNEPKLPLLPHDGRLLEMIDTLIILSAAWAFAIYLDDSDNSLSEKEAALAEAKKKSKTSDTKMPSLDRVVEHLEALDTKIKGGEVSIAKKLEYLKAVKTQQSAAISEVNQRLAGLTAEFLKIKDEITVRLARELSPEEASSIEDADLRRLAIQVADEENSNSVFNSDAFQNLSTLAGAVVGYFLVPPALEYVYSMGSHLIAGLAKFDNMTRNLDTVAEHMIAQYQRQGILRPCVEEGSSRGTGAALELPGRAGVPGAVGDVVPVRTYDATIGRPDSRSLNIQETTDAFVKATKANAWHNNVYASGRALEILKSLAGASPDEKAGFYHALRFEFGIEDIGDLRSFLYGVKSIDGEPATNVVEALIYRSIKNPAQLAEARYYLARIYSPLLIAEEMAYITETHDNLGRLDNLADQIVANIWQAKVSKQLEVLTETTLYDLLASHEAFASAKRRLNTVSTVRASHAVRNPTSVAEDLLQVGLIVLMTGHMGPGQKLSQAKSYSPAAYTKPGQKIPESPSPAHVPSRPQPSQPSVH